MSTPAEKPRTADQRALRVICLGGAGLVVIAIVGVALGLLS